MAAIRAVVGEDVIRKSIKAAEKAKIKELHIKEAKVQLRAIANANGNTLPGGEFQRADGRVQSLIALGFSEDMYNNEFISSYIRDATAGDEAAKNTAVKNCLQAIDQDVNEAAQFIREMVEDVLNSINAAQRDAADQAGKNQAELARTLEVMYPFMQEAAAVTCHKAQDYLAQIEPILKIELKKHTIQK